jgi:hypothetical protein
MKSPYRSILAIFLLISGFTDAQSCAPCDTLSLISDSKDPEKVFRFFLRQEISRTAHVNSNGAFANTAGVSTSADALDLHYNFLFNRSALDLNASGGLKEGALEISRNSKLSSNVVLGANYKYVFKAGMEVCESEIDNIRAERVAAKIKRERALAKTDEELAKWKKEVVELKNQLNKDSVLYGRMLILTENTEFHLAVDSLLYARQCAEMDFKMTTLKGKRSRLQELNTKIKAEQLRLAAIPIDKRKQEDSVQLVSLRWKLYQISDSLLVQVKDSTRLRTEMKENEFSHEKLKALEQRMNHARRLLSLLEQQIALDPMGNIARFKLESEFCESVEKSNVKIRELRPSSIRMHWFDLGGSLKMEEFTLYDPSLALGSRMYKEQDYIPSFSASYTYFRDGSYLKNGKNQYRDIRFFSIKAEVSYGNNSDDLTQFEIETRDSLASNQFKVANQSVYEGKFETNIARAKFSADYYHLYGTKDNAGYHLRAQVDLGPFAPVTSLRLGILFSVLDKDKQDAFVNFEVFYHLKDIFNGRSEKTLLTRNVFGIQSSFPFKIARKDEK